MNSIKKIVVTGPESSGKTTLCKALSKELGLSWVKEYARTYLEQTNGNYSFNDLVKIAQGQERLISNEIDNAQKGIICDTDLLTIKIWSEYKFHRVNTWISETLIKQKADLYLLCKPDIPWEADSLRENESSRDTLFEIYRSELEKLNVNFKIISGSKEERLNFSIEHIRGIL